MGFGLGWSYISRLSLCPLGFILGVYIGPASKERDLSLAFELVEGRDQLLLFG